MFGFNIIEEGDISEFSYNKKKNIDKFKLSELIDPLATKTKISLRKKIKEYSKKFIIFKKKKKNICTDQNILDKNLPILKHLNYFFQKKMFSYEFGIEKLETFNLKNNTQSNEKKNLNNKTIICNFKGICYLYRQTLNVVRNNNKIYLRKVDTFEKLIDLVLEIDHDYKCGRLGIKLTKILYPLIDNPNCLIEAKIIDQVINSPKSEFIAYKLNIRIKTTPIFFNIIKRQAEIEEITLFQQQVKTIENINVENFNKEFGCSMNIFKDYKGIDPSEDVITILKQHQRIALEWLLFRENPDSTVKHIKKIEMFNGEIKWKCEITGKQYKEPPPPSVGGLLADDMGLGKTLQILALIVTNSRSQTNGILLGPTLIICPLAVMNNWSYQIHEHISQDKIKFLEYHGNDRNPDPEYIFEYNIVITTYNILIQDSFLEETGLNEVKWLRVVLDEAHNIRSRKTKKWKCCVSINAERRWALTGTPIQNKLDDLFSLFAFLRVHPWTEYRIWKSMVLDQFKNGNSMGLKILQDTLNCIGIRRTKTMEIDGKPIIDLPERTVITIKVKFTKYERNRYENLQKLNKHRFRQINENGELLSSWYSILSMILRQRQLCAHHWLCRPKGYTFTSKNDLNVLEENDAIECSICEKSSRELVITKCKHIYCYNCLSAEIQKDFIYHCIICSKSIKKYEFKKLNTEERLNKLFKKSFIPKYIRPSSKILKLIDCLKNPGKEKKIPKTIVFSQWTSFLDIISKFLVEEKITYCRLDGSMCRKTRIKQIKRFKEDLSIKVFLMTLKAGGLGLNLTMASRVILVDPWWNPSAEDQATDRIYRLGQKKPVTILRFIMKNSIEEGIVKIQEKKRDLIKSIEMGKIITEENQDKKEERMKELAELIMKS